MKPSIGRIVHFIVGESGVSSLKDKGGNSHCYKPGDKIAAVVVCVWSDTCVNLKLLLDGPNDSWETSVRMKEEGDTPASGNRWEWPERV